MSVQEPVPVVDPGRLFDIDSVVDMLVEPPTLGPLEATLYTSLALLFA